MIECGLHPKAIWIPNVIGSRRTLLLLRIVNILKTSCRKLDSRMRLLESPLMLNFGNNCLKINAMIWDHNICIGLLRLLMKSLILVILSHSEGGKSLWSSCTNLLQLCVEVFST